MRLSPHPIAAQAASQSHNFRHLIEFYYGKIVYEYCEREEEARKGIKSHKTLTRSMREKGEKANRKSRKESFEAARQR